MIITDIHTDKLELINNSTKLLILPFYDNKQLSVISIYVLDNKEYDKFNLFVFPINHYDNLLNINIQFIFKLIKDKEVFCINKKELLKLGFSNQLQDLILFNYLETNNVIRFDLQINPIESIIHIIQKTKDIILELLPIYSVFSNNETYTLYNNTFLKELNILEENGLCVDTNLYKQIQSIKLNSNILNSNYNLYTTTGRPSNTNIINLSALKKDNIEREMIISRFNTGKLVEFDYSAYHLSILSKLIKYKIEKGINLHEYLGKQYYNVEELTTEQYTKTKELNFQLLYGSIPIELLEIPFFNKVNKYLDKIWEEYKKNKFILSPVSKRKIQNIKNVNKNKLLNYLLQLLETEINFKIIGLINNYLKTKQTKLILYTYDSFLFDIPENEFNIVSDLESIICKYNFYITKKEGKNYRNMKKILK